VRYGYIFATDKLRNGCKLGCIETNREGRNQERDPIDPPDREMIENKHQWNRRDKQRPSNIDENHKPPAVQAINPGANNESEKQIRQETSNGGQRQIYRRVTQIENQEW